MNDYSTNKTYQATGIIAGIGTILIGIANLVVGVFRILGAVKKMKEIKDDAPY